MRRSSPLRVLAWTVLAAVASSGCSGREDGRSHDASPDTHLLDGVPDGSLDVGRLETSPDASSSGDRDIHDTNGDTGSPADGPLRMSDAMPDGRADGGTGDGGATPTRYGFTAFPYDTTARAQEKTYDLIAGNGNLFVIWLDDCVTWYEERSGASLNTKTAQDWAGIKAALTQRRFMGDILLALAPTQTDRSTVNLDCASKHLGDGEYSRVTPLEPNLPTMRLNNPKIIDLYGRYVERAVRYFNPKFLNVGIEMGFPVAKSTSILADYSALHMSVYGRIKSSHPNVLVTFSNSPYVMQTRAPDGRQYGEHLRALNERYVDFLGVGYYPNCGVFFEATFNAAPAPDGRAGWLSTLRYVETYAQSLNPPKRIGLLDTGMTSRNVSLAPYFPIQINGSDADMAQWVRDFIADAKAHSWVLVNWWNPVDYDPIWQRMPGDTSNARDPEGMVKQVASIWKNMGLWRIPSTYPTTPDPEPKPALAAWKSGWGY